MKWLETQGLDLKSNLRLRLGTREHRGKAFEEVVMLYLLRILRHPTPLSTIFDFHSLTGGRKFRPRSLDASEGLMDLWTMLKKP